MDIISLIIFLAVGALAGWLAGNIVKGSGFGLLGITTGGLLGSIIMATIGAVILLYIVSIIKKT